MKEGLKQGRDVLVIAAKPAKDLEALRKAGFPAARFSFITHANPDIIKRFSPKDQVATVQIQNGRIVERAAG